MFVVLCRAVACDSGFVLTAHAVGVTRCKLLVGYPISRPHMHEPSLMKARSATGAAGGAGTAAPRRVAIGGYRRGTVLYPCICPRQTARADAAALHPPHHTHSASRPLRVPPAELTSQSVRVLLKLHHASRCSWGAACHAWPRTQHPKPCMPRSPTSRRSCGEQASYADRGCQDALVGVGGSSLRLVRVALLVIRYRNSNDNSIRSALMTQQCWHVVGQKPPAAGRGFPPKVGGHAPG